MKKQKSSIDPRFFYILSFFAGVVVTTTFYWFMFKEPKKINITGVTTLIGVLLSISTFFLALWSAFKVNKWLNNKINDKGFKQAEKILEQIENITINVDPFIKQLDDIAKIVKVHGPIVFNEKDEIELEKNSKQVLSYCDQLYMAERMLKYWDTEFSEEGKETFIKLTESLCKAAIASNNLPFIKDSEPYESTLNLIKKEYIESMDAMKKLLEFSYTDLFSHNIKSKKSEPKENPNK